MFSKIAQSKDYYAILDKLPSLGVYLDSLVGDELLQRVKNISNGANIIDSSMAGEGGFFILVTCQLVVVYYGI